MLSAASFAAALAAFLVLAVLTLTLWRDRPGALSVVVASLLTAGWAADLSSLPLHDDARELILASGSWELMRAAGWFVVLLAILHRMHGHTQRGKRTLRLWAIVLSGFLLLMLVPVVGPELGLDGVYGLALLLMTIAGLVLVEQVYRNTPEQERWGIKLLCLGVGGLFAFDLFVLADLVLFQAVEATTAQARGLINALVVPLVAVSLRRQLPRGLAPTVSRHLVFHTAALTGAGLYLLAVGAASYLLREFGGDWGALLQSALLFGAGLLLVLVLFSGSFQARLRVLINKHFFNYKYDYHDEWLRFTATLSKEHDELPFRQRAIYAVAELVDSPGGVLWVQNPQGDYDLEGVLNLGEPNHPPEPQTGSLAQYLFESGWVIDVDEYRDDPAAYPELALPEWLLANPRYWLVVPLLQGSELTGFVVLAQPRAPRPIEWEDRDLLKIAGRQLAVYVALTQVGEALAEARQFETFHRLAAFLVHDLKNVSGQLSLVLANAERHRDNPEFLENAFRTVGHARERLDRTLAQLRNAQPEQAAPAQRVELGAVLRQVLQALHGEPQPELTVEQEVQVIADQERLANVVAHLVRNAQDATPADGWIRLRLSQREEWGYIVIEDTGQGMDEAFLRERLFRPFQTTKGNAGMGIGVYEAREYIASLGGRIEVSSRPGAGTRFTVQLLARGSAESSLAAAG
ncbi:XrtA/PEP-CTERM system histidine kinase PrsK [Halorhodospira halophila]|uniref:histidine kinase n=1 Tax=Halorhodospira halophila (strain DSM 244 / SL1) TaxID=349124 RepID=A1WX89_HALHL|nr:XrtA/PEP-CTERM system histidine kinase PrsK [Halorhodospira halophila]ABM62301.1 multi-sensor signal transduction histidine kinase [Halorhodospira halophila SL1]MBK1729276.1 PEP-CTERM system histidine kinase PrsK [Halorhodospira halophila]